MSDFGSTAAKDQLLPHTEITPAYITKPATYLSTSTPIGRCFSYRIHLSDYNLPLLVHLLLHAACANMLVSA